MFKCRSAAVVLTTLLLSGTPAFGQNASTGLKADSAGVANSPNSTSEDTRGSAGPHIFNGAYVSSNILLSADTNHDGQVSFKEMQVIFPHLMLDEFNRADSDHNGSLSSDELKATSPQKSADAENTPATFKHADANKDGKVTYEELVAVAPRFQRKQFEKLDTNADGTLTTDEWAAAIPGASPQSTLSDGRLAEADANRDGVLTFEEMKNVLPNLTKKEFDATDLNHDGKLTVGELHAQGTKSLAQR